MLMDKVKPMSPGQQELMKSLLSDEYEVIGVFGPTGTGKSLISLLYGLEAVTSGRYRRFIVARPIVDVVTNREVTSLEAGDMYYDLASAYLKDLLTGLVEWSDVEALIRQGKLVFADTHYLRGRTFDHSVVLIDDAQAVSPESAIEVFMRIGRESKFIVAGDPVLQSFLGSDASGITVLREVLLGEERAKVVDLGLKDIVRPGAKRGIRLLLEMKMRKRPLSESERRVVEVARTHSPDADVITALDLLVDKSRFNISVEHVPDALIVVKEGYLARLIGRGGERITKMEREVGMKLRALELTLNFVDFIRAIHPVAWAHKHVVDADFAGPSILVKVKGEFGAFVGQKGSHVKFMNSAFRRLMGVGLVAREIEEAEKTSAKRSRKRR